MSPGGLLWTGTGDRADAGVPAGDDVVDGAAGDVDGAELCEGPEDDGGVLAADGLACFP